MMEDQDGYRQADQEDRCSAVDGAGDSARACPTPDSPESVEGAEQDALRESAGGGAGGVAAFQQLQMVAAQQQALTAWMSQYGAATQTGRLYQPPIPIVVNPLIGVLATYAQPEPPLEDGGVIVGEFEGWRAWKVEGNELRSVSMDTPWVPGETMEGDPQQMHRGVYAFKTRAQLHASGLAYEYKTIAPPYVWGRVKMWGNIIEHEGGYRAQYAKITHIDGGDGPVVLKLRQIYGVDGEAQPERTVATKVADTVFRPRFSGLSALANGFLLFCGSYALVMIAVFLYGAFYDYLHPH